MRRPTPPAFLERRSYRRRRLTEAAMLLPVLGVGLFCVPLLWRGGPEVGSGYGSAAAPVEASGSTADVMLYVFGVWALLAGLSAIFARRLGQDEAEQGADASDQGRGPKTGGTPQ